MRMSTAGNRSEQRGFTYAVVLASVVAVGIAAEGAHLLTSRVVRADKEAELIFRGLSYRRAIEAYYRDHGRFPRHLEDLVRDPSSASRRYLRALYADPMSKAKQDTWVVFETADGGINGVASRSTDVPSKKANFPPELDKFIHAETYSEWVFQYTPTLNPPGAPGLITPPPANQF
jgi:type II secretory pathway pseudopilin PulG